MFWDITIVAAIMTAVLVIIALIIAGVLFLFRKVI